MTARKPLVSIAGDIKELPTGDVLAVSAGGSGQSALGSSLQVLRTNAAGDATEWAHLAPRITTPAYSANLTLNWAVADVIRVTLTGNITITNSGAIDGQKCILELLQDGTGSRTVAFTSETRFGVSVPSFTATTTLNKMDRLGFIYDGAATKYDVLAISKGF